MDNEDILKEICAVYMQGQEGGAVACAKAAIETFNGLTGDGASAERAALETLGALLKVARGESKIPLMAPEELIRRWRERAQA